MWRRIAELAAGDLSRPINETSYVQLAWLEHALTRAFAVPFPGEAHGGLHEVESVEDFARVLATYDLPKGWCEADPGVNGGCVCEELRFGVECWLAEHARPHLQIHIRPNAIRALLWRSRLVPLRAAVLTFAQEAQMYWPATEALERPLEELSYRLMRETFILPMMRVWWERTQTLTGIDLPAALGNLQRQQVLDETLERLEWWKKDVPSVMDEAKHVLLGMARGPEERKALYPAFQRMRNAMQFEKTQHAPILCFEANVDNIYKDIIRSWPGEFDGPRRREAFLAAFLCYQANPTIQYLQHHSHVIQQLQWVIHWDRNRRGRSGWRQTDDGADPPVESVQARTLVLQPDEDVSDPLGRVCELAALTDLLTKRLQVLCLLDNLKWLASVQVMTDMLCLHYGGDVRGSVRMRRIISQWKWLFCNAVPGAYMSWFNPDVACILLDYLLQDDEVTSYTLYGLHVGTIAHRLLAFTAIYAITNRALDNEETAHLDEFPPDRWQAIARGEYLPNEEEETAMGEDERLTFNRMRCERIAEMIKRCEMADTLAGLAFHRLQPEYPLVR